MKQYLFYTCLALASLMSPSCTGDANPLYRNADAPVDRRVEDLLGRMTVEEKVKQLDMYRGAEVADMEGHEAVACSAEKVAAAIGTSGIGSVHDLYPLKAETANDIQRYAVEKTRLGIPVLFIEEGLHGYCGKESTTFPIPLQLAGAFDTTLVRKIGEVIAAESRAHGTAMILGPVLDVARDPRWGRLEETYGEDPYLVALNGTAIVRGMQGGSLAQPNTVVAEPKHFAAHGLPEAGSNTAPVLAGERELRTTFLFPFEKAVREGGARGIMAAYHELDGIPSASNRWLLTDILRREWGFDGFVLSDLGAIKMTLETHRTARDTTHALAESLKAGLNMQFYDFGHATLLAAVEEALATGLLTGRELDNAVRDILRVKFLLGLFESPYTDPALLETFHSDAHQALALEAAQKSIVLLKNEGSVLPLEKENLRIAVVGELAESTYPGGYSHPRKQGISILDGLRQRAGKGQTVAFEKGYSFRGTESGLLQRAVSLARSSDVVVVVVGENMRIVGEGKDRADITLDSEQTNLVNALQTTGTPTVAVLFNGRPLAVNEIAQSVPAVLETWFSGEKGGLAIADVLLGRVNPSGKLSVTIPRSIGQVPFYYYGKPSSRHAYVDEKRGPLYAFGHGLSYTTFEYSNMNVSPGQIGPDGSATVRLTVTNTGDREGEEVVQLYIRDVTGSVATPVKALKGFRRVSLKPGESREVDFHIGAEALWLWNREMKRVVEPGEFTVMAGRASDNILLEGSLTVTE
ncbi:MAG: glycoside hydrolase family 3 C-terminal domain-containing protein [Tannerella sp.]|jgi:beta-glucosidase|nr:glycoside hydrolase family 3 C-terminal domain-containing protein [Tannerella sp.]